MDFEDNPYSLIHIPTNVQQANDLPYIVTELSSYPRIHILLTNNELMNRSIS